MCVIRDSGWSDLGSPDGRRIRSHRPGRGKPASPQMSQKPSPDSPLISRLALPDHNDSPTQIAQCSLVSCVPRHVFLKLLRPELNPGLRAIGIPAAVMPMPETAMNEYYGSIPWKYQVWRTRKIPAMQAKTEPEPVGDATDGQFRRGVPSLDARHDLATLLGIHDVSHYLLVSML